MPEGLEVRRYADLLSANSENEWLIELTTQFKIAKS
jgi:hypothetical protein